MATLRRCWSWPYNLGHERTPRRSVELSCLCFLGDHYYYHLITCWTLYKHGLFIGFPCIGFVALEDLFCPSFNFCELHESMCGMFLIKERQETYEPRRNVNASFISLIIFHVSFQVMGATGAFSGAVNLRPKEGKEEKLEQRQITPARRRMPWMPWMPWRLFGGLHSVRFDPPPREPKGPKVSLPEKLPEVSIELPIEKEGKEEDFRKLSHSFEHTKKI